MNTMSNNDDASNRSNTVSSPIEAVLEEYAATSSGPSYALLLEWMDRYPQYRAELADFTASWTEVAPLSAPTLVIDSTDALQAAQHMSLVRSILDSAYAAPVQEPVKVQGTLLAIAKKQGLNRKQLAEATGLSITLLDKLDRKLIRAASIPGAIIGAMARALNKGRDAVASCLEGPSMLPMGASYKSDKAPTVPQQQDFADAVKSDSSLSSERKQELLSLSENDDNR